MLNLPVIDDYGFQQADNAVKAVSFTDMWNQLKTYQPGYTEFLKGFWKGGKIKKVERKRHVTLLWHAFSTLSGQFLHLNSLYYQTYQAIVYLLTAKGTIEPSKEVLEVNETIAANKASFATGDMLADMIGDKEALPVIHLCSESLDPAVTMTVALYMATLMKNKATEKQNAIHNN